MDAYVTTHHRTPSEAQPPTPPPTITIPELQKRTFDLLKEYKVVPKVTPGAELILCAGRRSTTTPGETVHLGLVQCLVNQPDYLSITLTDTEPPSLLIERDQLYVFGAQDTLLGNKHEILIPIMLDLRQLPVESTGIVCGVAGRLCGEHGSFLDKTDPIDMSYLSTARAGTVMVAEDDIDRAMEALRF